MTSASKPRRQIERNDSPPVIRDGELYSLAECARRLRWGREAIRQAKRRGLRVTRFATKDYVVGRDVIAFLDGIGDQEEPKK